MNQQDVFLVNMRELYARRIHKDPVWRDTSYSGVPRLNPAQESGSESSMFIVDWQMECSEIQIVEAGYPHPGKENPRMKSEGWTIETTSADKEAITNIFDW